MMNKENISLSVLAIVGVCVGLLNSFGIPAAGKDRSSKIAIQLPSERPFPIPANWKGLIPLKSTRSEVEKILGKPRRSVPGPDIYENESERVDVGYARDRCEPWNGDWNVPANTVIRIEVRPIKTLLLEDLSFDKSKYVARKWSHPSDWITYSNVQEGISLETTDLGKNTEIVRVIRYSPKSSDQTLKCNKKQ